MPVVEFTGRLVTTGFRVSIDGASPVRRLHQAGWVGLTQHSTSPLGDIVVWQAFLENEFQDFAVSYAPGMDPDTLYWDISTDTELELWVFW